MSKERDKSKQKTELLSSLQSNNVKRITAWIALVAVVFVMLFSVAYISHHAGHKCTGAECPVCAVMEQCSNTIKSIGTVIFVAVAYFICLSIRKGVQHTTAVHFCNSLVFQKVRMNN